MAVRVGMLEDFRHAWRALRRRPAFAALAGATLALGIGANSALFSVLNAVVLRPLPYQEPERLYVVRTASRASGELAGISVPDYEDVRALDGPIEIASLSCYWTFNLTGRAVPERLVGARVSGSFFETLGVPPLVGRALGASDDRAGAPEAIVLSQRLWQRLFQADPGVVGRSVSLNGVGATVVGVMPASFHFPGEDVELWAAISNNMSGMPRDSRFLSGLVRLRAGSARAAHAAVEALSRRLSAAHPQTNAERALRLQPLHEAAVGRVREGLWLLSGAVSLLLLLAGVNVGHLLLAQALLRRRDDAVRLALGASPWRLLRLQAAENLLLALLGAGAGVMLAFGTVAALRARRPAWLPRLDEVRVDLSVLGFASCLALAVALALAALRAFERLRSHPAPALAAGRAGVLGARRSLLRSGLLVTEVALAAVLLVGGVQFLRSLRALLSVDPGFDSARVVTARVFLGPPRYRTIPQQKGYVRGALERLASLPGSEASGVVTQLPLSEPGTVLRISILGQSFQPDRAPRIEYRVVNAGYFDALRIPLLRGRSVLDGDDEQAPPVAVLNAVAARRLFPGVDPVGQKLRLEGVGPTQDWMTVVGVVSDVRSRTLAKEEEPVLYGSYLQRRAPWLRWASFTLRTRRPGPEALLAMREALLQVDPDQPVYELASLDSLRARSLEVQTLQTALLDLFAALAVALAAIGTYGVLNHGVRQRTAEIGVRMALGARSGDVARLIVSGALGPAALGLLLGLPVATLAARAIESQLYGVRASDPLGYLLVALLLLSVSALSAALPARRALRIDPAVALREG